MLYAHKCKKSSRLRRTELGDAAGASAKAVVPDLDDGDMIVTMITLMSHIETSFDMCKQTLSAVLSHNRNNFWSVLIFALVFCYQVSATSTKHFVSLRIARIALVSLSSPTVSPVSPLSPCVKSASYRYRAMNIRKIDFWPSLQVGVVLSGRRDTMQTS
jgi:hypothetical protein